MNAPDLHTPLLGDHDSLAAGRQESARRRSAAPPVPYVVHARLDGSDARVLTATGAPAEAPGDGGRGATPVVWLVATEDLLLTARDLRVRRRDLEQALPYALEEDLVGEPDGYALAHAGTGGRIHVAAADRVRLRAGFEALRGRGLRPRAIMPDVLALPLEEGAWSLLVDGGRAMVRSGELTGFACRVENLPFLLGRALAEAAEAPARLAVYGDGAALPPLPLEAEPRPGHGPAAVLAGGVAARPRLNLLSRAAAARAFHPADRRRLVAAGAVLAVALAGFLGARWYEVAELRAGNARLAAAVEDVYRDTFPDHSRVVDARLQMEQALHALRGGGDAATGFLPLLHAAREELGPGRLAALLGLRFSEGDLALDLELPGLQAVDRLRAALESHGVRATVEAVEKADPGVRVTLRLSGARA